MEITNMKFIRNTARFVMLTISIFLPMIVPALAANTVQAQICSTSNELVSYVLRMVGDREGTIGLSVPNTLPEADMGSEDLLRHILRQDSGFIRWGHKGGTATKITAGGYTTFTYKLTYHTTKEQDEAARRLASSIVGKWTVKNLPDREKMDKLKEYITANWRYDAVLDNMTAYPTLISGKGTCLGLVLACQLLLDDMGIPSQTIHGRLIKTGALHIKLLVRLEDWWYIFDPTELAQDIPGLSAYLKSTHVEWMVLNDEYLTESFQASRPMSLADLEVELPANSSTPQPTPAIIIAKPTTSTVLVNDKSIVFDAYNINGNNYFKLRDVAYILSGTKKQFNVGWDDINNAISLTSGKSYTVIGGEMMGKGVGDKTTMPIDSKVYLDGKEVTFIAYNIEGNNYFKIRDIGATFDFGVDWDGQNNTIVIDTSKVYMPQ